MTPTGIVMRVRRMNRERRLKRAQKKLAREKKKGQKQRRLKRTRIFTANEIAEQMNELERMAEERLQEKVSKKRIRRINKKKSCPLSPGVASSFVESSPVKGSSRKLSTKEPNMEKEDSNWIKLCKFIKEYDFENKVVESLDLTVDFERDPQ